MISVSGITDVIQGKIAVDTTTNAIEVTATYVTFNLTSTKITAVATVKQKISLSASAVTLVPAASATTGNGIRTLQVFNADTISSTFTLSIYDGSVNTYRIATITLDAGDTLTVSEDKIVVTDSNGNEHIIIDATSVTMGGDVTGNSASCTVAKINGNSVPSGVVLGDLLYGSGASALSKLAGNTTTTQKVLTQTGTGSASAAPAWTDVAATQAQQEAGSATTSYVTPAVQQSHPSAAKAWFALNWSGGTPTNLASYNVTSYTDTGTGTVTVNLTTAFSSASYAVALGYQSMDSTVQQQWIFDKSGSTASASRFKYFSSGSLTDNTNYVSAAMYGDQ